MKIFYFFSLSLFFQLSFSFIDIAAVFVFPLSEKKLTDITLKNQFKIFKQNKIYLQIISQKNKLTSISLNLWKGAVVYKIKPVFADGE